MTWFVSKQPIMILLETGEDLADFFGAAEVGDGVGDGVVVFEAE